MDPYLSTDSPQDPCSNPMDTDRILKYCGLVLRRWSLSYGCQYVQTSLYLGGSWSCDVSVWHSSTRTWVMRQWFAARVTAEVYMGVYSFRRHVNGQNQQARYYRQRMDRDSRLFSRYERLYSRRPQDIILPPSWFSSAELWRAYETKRLRQCKQYNLGLLSFAHFDRLVRDERIDFLKITYQWPMGTFILNAIAVYSSHPCAWSVGVKDWRVSNSNSLHLRWPFSKMITFIAMWHKPQRVQNLSRSTSKRTTKFL